LKNAEAEHGKWDLNVQVDNDIHKTVKSDPPFNSHSGYETRHSNPTDPDPATTVEYNFDPKLDHDIISTE